MVAIPSLTPKHIMKDSNADKARPCKADKTKHIEKKLYHADTPFQRNRLVLSSTPFAFAISDIGINHAAGNKSRSMAFDKAGLPTSKRAKISSRPSVSIVVRISFMGAIYSHYVNNCNPLN